MKHLPHYTLTDGARYVVSIRTGRGATRVSDLKVTEVNFSTDAEEALRFDETRALEWARQCNLRGWTLCVAPMPVALFS